MTRRNIIIAGTAAFVLAFLAQAPVAILFGWFAPKEMPLELHGLQGTLLHGSVAGIGRQGQPAWQELRWTLRPLGLLTGRVVADVETTTPAAIRSRVSLAPWGSSLSGLRAAGSVRSVLSAVGQGFLPVEGQLDADLKSLRLRDGKPSSAEGMISIEGLAWTLAKDPVVLGNYQAVATTENDRILLKIESIAGPLDVSGTATLTPDQAYSLDLKVKPKPGAPPMVQSLVQSLGRPDAQGYYYIQRKGTLA